ncbi:hypothetical protein Hanom_Chr07g00599911 [Helianthus anomalus]
MLASVDAVERYTKLCSYPLHKTKNAAILNIYIHQSKVIFDLQLLHLLFVFLFLSAHLVLGITGLT